MSEHRVVAGKFKIDAPIEYVWSVLTDTSTYREWNPFTPAIACDFSVGTPAELRVRMGPIFVKIVETVRVVDPPYMLTWDKSFGSKSLLHAVRFQRLERLDKASCTYSNEDILTGLLSPCIAALFRRFMVKGFDDVGFGLKQYCESNYARKGVC